jgi:hypothetical protein
MNMGVFMGDKDKSLSQDIKDNAKETVKTLAGGHSVQVVAAEHLADAVNDWKIKLAQSFHDPEAEALLRKAHDLKDTKLGVGAVIPALRADGRLIADEFAHVTGHDKPLDTPAVPKTPEAKTPPR